MGKHTVGTVSFSESILGKMPEWSKNDNTLMDTYGLSCCPGFESEYLPSDVASESFKLVGPGDIFRTDLGKTATVVSASAKDRAILFCIKRGKKNTYVAVDVDFVINNYEMVRSRNGTNNF
jgi:hypothetical protein